MSGASERTALYHVYGDEDLLLYIGVSKDFGSRWKAHAKAQPWWDEHRRMTVTWYDSRPKAEEAEAAAIKAEKPKYNVTHAGAPNKDQLNRPPVPAERAVALKIRALRQESGWSQFELARRMAEAGWSWYGQTVARIELCQRHVRLGELESLSVVFGVAPLAFLERLDIPDAIATRSAMERELREEIAAEILADVKRDRRLVGVKAIRAERGAA